MNSKLILLVEDSDSQAKVLKAILEQKGFVVATAGSCSDMQKFVEQENCPEIFLAICDINLPDAPNGEAVDWLLDQGLDTIVYTASLSDKERDAMMAKAIVDYVLKHDANSLVLLAEHCETLWHNTHLKVLVVDDAPSSLALMKHLVASQKLNVDVASTAAEARTKAKSFQPDLIIIDLILPDTDGATLSRQIRNDLQGRDVLIIGVSVQSEVQSTINFIKQGANDFIAKPFTQEEFICRLNQLANNAYRQKQLMSRLERHDLMNQMLSHDIRSPVSAMVSLSNILAQTLDIPDDKKRMIESIAVSGQEVVDLLEDALNLHKLDHSENLQLEQIALSGVVTDLIHDLRERAEAKEIQLMSKVGKDEVVLSNLRLFKQCLLNLVDNAIKYSPEETRVTIRSKAEQNHIRLEVVDQGLGIPVEEAEKLFQPFAKLSNKPTAGESSSGLGLSIVKRMINLLGGDIAYEPGPDGKGSCFSLIIPKAYT